MYYFYSAIPDSSLCPNGNFITFSGHLYATESKEIADSLNSISERFNAVIYLGEKNCGLEEILKHEKVQEYYKEIITLDQLAKIDSFIVSECIGFSDNSEDIYGYMKYIENDVIPKAIELGQEIGSLYNGCLSRLKARELVANYGLVLISKQYEHCKNNMSMKPKGMTAYTFYLIYCMFEELLEHASREKKNLKNFKKQDVSEMLGLNDLNWMVNIDKVKVFYNYFIDELYTLPIIANGVKLGYEETSLTPFMRKRIKLIVNIFLFRRAIKLKMIEFKNLANDFFVKFIYKYWGKNGKANVKRF